MENDEAGMFEWDALLRGATVEVLPESKAKHFQYETYFNSLKYYFKLYLKQKLYERLLYVPAY